MVLVLRKVLVLVLEISTLFASKYYLIFYISKVFFICVPGRVRCGLIHTYGASADRDPHKFLHSADGLTILILCSVRV